MLAETFDHLFVSPYFEARLANVTTASKQNTARPLLTLGQ